MAYGSADAKKNHLVIIDDRAAGESSGSVYYGPDIEEIVDDLEEVVNQLRSLKSLAPSDLEDLNSMAINNVSKAGLMGAVLHYLSLSRNVYPWELQALEAPSMINTSYTIGLDNPENMVRSINDSLYPIIKIKMGGEDDEVLAEQLGKIQGKLFRVDANGGWNLEQAERMIYYLDKLNVDIIEQPTNPEFISDWPYIKGKSGIKIIVDEGLNTVDDYYQYADYIDGVNIKMAKSGGIVEAKKIALAARKNKRKVMLGCMIESSIGISQAVYLSSLADYFDLDSPLLLKEDIATGINYDLNKVSVDDNIIGGPKIKEVHLAAKDSK